MKLILSVSTLTLLLELCSGARILGLLPMPSQSHSILLERLMNELSNKGHEITYITATVPSKPIANMNVIHVPGVYDAIMSSFQKSLNSNTTSMLKMPKPSPWLMSFFAGILSNPMEEHILSHPDVQKLLKSNEKFDLIFGEIMMDEAILAGLSYKFKAPVVAFATFMPSVFSNYLVGNPSPASFIPDALLPFGTKMSFFERVENFVFGMLMEANHILNYIPAQDKVLKKFFGNDLPYVGDILKNTSLVLVNHHHSLAFPRPYLPNMIEIAGVHINDPKPLPKDLQTFMNDSKKGVVYFSLGSNANSSDLEPELVSSILKGLGKLEQNVLWKFEADLSPHPKNVKIIKWAPQSDILAHPNLKVFITHGGMLSTTEALSRAVPVVGIPLFGDQHTNMKMTSDAGWGVTLDLEELDGERLYNAVTEVLNNPRYKTNVIKKSAIFNDNPMSALDTATWWIDYVIRHKGARHLRSAAQDLSWYELYLLDVYALAAAIFIPIAAINFLITRAIFRNVFGKCCCSTKKEEIKKGKKTKKTQ